MSARVFSRSERGAVSYTGLRRQTELLYRRIISNIYREVMLGILNTDK